MTKLQQKVADLQAEGYDIADIANELGIKPAKVQKVLDELEMLEEETPTPVATKKTELQQKMEFRKRQRAEDDLKDEFDEIVYALDESDGEDMLIEKVKEFLVGVRELDFSFRKFAKTYGLSPDNLHRDFLVQLIAALKEMISEANEDEEADSIEIDYDEDLLETATDLRFELLEFEPLEA